MEETITKLRTLTKEESTQLLQSLTIKALKSLAAEANISVAGTKDRIINQITNHYGYTRLNKAMTQRPLMHR
jgi:hypothetical protein